MQVTVEGVVHSDVLARGERATVELTDYVRGLIRNRLVQVVETHGEPAARAPRRRKARS